MKLHKLTALKVKNATGNGLWSDGGYLYLQSRNGAKSWIFRHDGRYHGLGALSSVSLARARQVASEWRAAIARGEQPWERTTPKPPKAITFGQAAADYVAAHEPGWRNPKTAARWRSAIRLHIEPVIGKVD